MYQSKIESIIIRLKKAKNQSPDMTIQRVSEETGVSMSTVKRIFSDGSENQSFRYESLKPIALLLLGTDGLDEEIDNEEIQMQISELKDKYEKKLEKQRDQHRKSLDHLKHQIELKDARIDILLEEVRNEKNSFRELHKQYVDVVTQLLKREADK